MTTDTYEGKIWRGYCDGRGLWVPNDRTWIAGSHDGGKGILRWAGEEGGTYLSMSWQDVQREWHAHEFQASSDDDALAYDQYCRLRGEIYAEANSDRHDIPFGQLDPTGKVHAWLVELAEDYSGRKFVRRFESLSEMEKAPLTEAAKKRWGI